ncbi:MAG: ribonuclease HI family protein [Deltaproteobacteria bacterium]
MSDSKGAAEILKCLAAKLPDEALAACFPDHAPAALRDALRDAAQLVARHDRRTEATRRQTPDRRQLPDRRQATFALETKTEEPRPPGFRITLYTDGAARGTPGAAGAGILLLDDRGQEIAARGIYLGECTNNVAEYRALILGLQEARRHGAEELSIYLDSELIVKQMLGSYRVKDPKLKPLHTEAIALLEGFRFYQIVHVPRGENQRADQLANQGIDERMAE